MQQFYGGSFKSSCMTTRPVKAEMDITRWVSCPHGCPVQCSRRLPGALGLLFLLPCVCLIVSVCRSAVEVLCACDLEQALLECVRCVFRKRDFRLSASPTDPFHRSDFYRDLHRSALFEKPIGSGCGMMLDLEVLLDRRFATLRDSGGRAPSDSESTGQYALDEFKLRRQYFSHDVLHLRDIREVIGFGILRKKTVPKTC